jgi:NAD-dependent deacetylase
MHMTSQYIKRAAPHIVILTGAGISAESGLQTFRGSDGLWCGHRIEDVATPEGFAKHPARVQEFYNMRRAQLREVEPNVAHLAIAKLAAQWHGNVTLITQNVDDLHQRAAALIAPSERAVCYAMHGQLRQVRCVRSHQVVAWDEDITEATRCACCQPAQILRPHIVWFGEMPLFMPEIECALEACDIFFSIGTSGNVYPAAGFVLQLQHYNRTVTVELNLEPSLGTRYFDEARHGNATQIVPQIVDELLSGAFIA